MRKNWRMLAVVAGALLMGCAGDQTVARPDPTALSDGLTVLDKADPKWGFDAAYKKDGHVVYFESRVGDLKPEIYREVWPDDPAEEMDARYVDPNGETFIVRRGGDAFIDPTWPDDIRTAKAKRTIPVDPEHRALSFQLAEEMSRVMTEQLGTQIPAAFKNHIVHAVSMGRLELPQVTAEEHAARMAEYAPPATEEGHTVNGLANYYYGQLYSGSVVYPVPGFPSPCAALGSLNGGGCGSQSTAYHSAVRFWNEDQNGNWTMYFDGCNHGRCPWDGLSYANGRYSKQGWNYSGNEVDIIVAGYGGADAVNSDNVGTGVTGACRTSYSWNSGSGSHLCNDDAAFEFYQLDQGQSMFCNGSGSSNFTVNYPYTSYWLFSCTPNDSTATYQCNGTNVYRDWLPPCLF